MNSTPAVDAWLESIREIVRQEVRTALAFSGLCDYRVVASPGAGGANTIDAVPVDQTAGLPPVQGVACRTGLPGGTVQVAPNAHVALAFLDQNPSKPFFVGAFDSTGALQIALNAGMGTSEHVTTIEAVCNLLSVLGPLTAGGGGWTAGSVQVAVIGAGNSALSPGIASAIAQALPLKTPDANGLHPNVGCPNLKTG
jgi:hypothetical protein